MLESAQPVTNGIRGFGALSPGWGAGLSPPPFPLADEAAATAEESDSDSGSTQHPKP
jgi:hypothetical protein